MLFVFMVLGLVFVACLILGFLKDEDWFTNALVVLNIAAIIGLCYLASYSTSLSSNAELIALDREVLTAYEKTAKITEKITIKGAAKGDDLLQGAYWKQAGVASDRWKELRDKIERYNTKLRSKKLYKQNWFLGIWIADVPPELAPIKFPEK